jgi:hypothetical protein
MSSLVFAISKIAPKLSIVLLSVTPASICLRISQDTVFRSHRLLQRASPTGRDSRAGVASRYCMALGPVGVFRHEYSRDPKRLSSPSAGEAALW